MAITAPAPPPAAVVARLRAAGCVFAEDEAALLVRAAGSAAELAAMVARRVGGEPVEQVVGFVDFCGLRVELAPGVFVPRRRSELLARTAADLAEPGSVVVDLCCGTGSVGAVVAAAAADVQLHAVDVDLTAVRCARRNLRAVGGWVHHGDLYAALPVALRGRVDVLVANAPYVPTDAIRLLPAEARRHEPRVALDGGADGLDVVRRVAADAPQWLAPGGSLLVESSDAQATDVTALFGRAGLDPRVVADDETDGTVVVGRAVSGRGCS
jgi:release factor glutamine methyltransferase